MAKLLKLLPWMALPLATAARLRAAVREKQVDPAKRLSPAQAYIWTTLLAVSNFCDERQRGRIVSEKDGEALSQRDLAGHCGVAVSTINAALRVFQARGWLDREGAVWVVRGHADWTVRDANGVREPNGGVRAANGVFPKANTSVREKNATPEAETARGNAGGDQKADPSLVELEDRLRRIVSQASMSEPHIETTEKTRDSRDIIGSTETTSSQRRPTTGLSEPLLGAVAGAFLQVVGRPLDQHDKAVLAEVINAGHTQEEVLRAVQQHGQRGQVRRSGLRYIKPMILAGDFREAPATRSPRIPPLPTGSITVGADAALIAQRNAKRRALLKTQDQ